MPTWSIGDGRAIADCGEFRGPWPVLAPDWTTLRAITSLRNPDVINNLQINYATGPLPPSGNAADFGDVFHYPQELHTWAQMGAGMAYDYVSSQYDDPEPWDTPKYHCETGSPPPDGDTFAGARIAYVPSPGGVFSDTAINNGASREVDEPIAFGATDRTVWWRYTPDADGDATIDTIGSSGDTVMGVYTGTDVDALTLEASDDDAGGSGTSELTITVTAGTAYYIQVGTYGRQVDMSYQLHVTGPQSADAPGGPYSSGTLYIPPFTTGSQLQQPGVHLFVVFTWSYLSASNIALLTRTIQTISPLSLVPATYVIGGTGPLPVASGIWSDWQDRSITAVHSATSPGEPQNFVASTIDYEGAASSSESWATATDRAVAALQAALPDAVTDGWDTSYSDSAFANNTSHVGFTRNADGSKQVTLSACQYAMPMVTDDWGSRLDTDYYPPPNLYDIITGPRLNEEPYFYATSDPYTFRGDGWQYEAASAQYLGANDSVPGSYLNYLASAGLVTAAIQDPAAVQLPPEQLLPMSCPMRIYARELTGPDVTDVGAWSGYQPGWLPFDGDAFLLGDSIIIPTVDSWQYATTSYFSEWSNALTLAYSRIPWRRFWLITEPSFVSTGGPLPEVPNWVGGVAGAASIYVQYGPPWGNLQGNFNPRSGGVSALFRFLMPRWRFWEPTIVSQLLATSGTGEASAVFGPARISR